MILWRLTYHLRPKARLMLKYINARVAHCDFDCFPLSPILAFTTSCSLLGTHKKVQVPQLPNSHCRSKERPVDPGSEPTCNG
jgi:hypothetical protein